MSTSVPANTQARVLLQTLCNFMLPLIQMAVSGQTMDSKNIRFAIEADEFVNELEKFISGMISRSQPRNQDIVIEARLGKDSFYHSEGDISTPEDEATNSNDKGNPEHISTNQDMVRYHTISPSVPIGANEEALAKNLQILRRYVTQNTPIRLLCFEPHNSKLKISLFERADIYDYLALKLRADFDKGPISGSLWYEWIPEHAGYAILSHTWNQTPGELIYGDWQRGPLEATQPKCQKLVNFCKATWENHGLTLGWMDTICINKESSAELDESIRSMYAWYRNAKVCVIYLAGSTSIAEMHNDLWFTRGWTLQELVAPKWERIKFYNMDWNQLSDSRDADDKVSVQAEITLATTITPDELQNFWRTSISRKMQLAAKRKVTRGEDIAYCLMGIFDVSISTAYGEGADRAFFRLVEEIFRSNKDVSDIFNWAGEPQDLYNWKPTTSLFPSRPSNYLNRSENKQLRPWRPIEPLTLTHLGLRMPILLMPAVPIHEATILKLAWGPDPQPVGDYQADVVVSTSFLWSFGLGGRQMYYRLLDKTCSGTTGELRTKDTKRTMAFGTLNVEEQGTSIRIPKTCLAVLLEEQMTTPSPRYNKLSTGKPIVFDLKKTGKNSDDNGDQHYYQIERTQLANHGMQLVTLIL